MKYLFYLKHFVIFILLLMYPLLNIPSSEGSIAIFLEMAKSDNKSIQLICVDYVEDHIKRWGSNEIILQTLDILVNNYRENPIIENGYVINDFPDIRISAINLLGILGTPEAYDILNEVLLFENNLEVLEAAQEVINK